MASQSTQRHTNIAALGNHKRTGAWRTGKLLAAISLAGTVLRGPWFSSIISVILLLTIPAAQATLLKGYAHTDMFGPVAAPADDINTSNQPAPQGEQAQQAMPPNLSKDPDSFPVSFAGTWRCVTVVVSSALPSVPVGETIESAVSFIRQPDGRILALWEQPGWTEAQQKVQPVSENEASLERTNYFLEPGAGGQWAAHSRDHYLRLDNNRMQAESRVDQFVGGQFMGRYETRSMLYRLNLAMRRDSSAIPRQ